jgi:dCTP deaminase
MLLSRDAIEHEIKETRIIITPFSKVRLRAASYVLSLGSRFRRWRPSDRPIVLWSEDASFNHLDEPLEVKEFTLMPGEFVLGCTMEEVSFPNDRFGIISPLSHIARFGLGVHGGADFINPGFGLKVPSRLTLELYNCNSSPLTLTSGMPITHLRIGILNAPNAVSSRLRSIYEGSDPVTAPQYFEEWHELSCDTNA